MRKKVDLRAYLPDLIAGVMLIGALGLVALAWMRFERMQQRELASSREVVGMRNAIQELRRNREEVEQYEPRYLALRSSGSLGTFDKPRALDDFASIVDEFADPVISLELAAQAPAALSAPTGLHSHDIFRHQLRFDLKPSHEASFGRMLATLDARIRETAAIEACELERSGRGTEHELRARCTLNFYSFLPRVKLPDAWPSHASAADGRNSDAPWPPAGLALGRVFLTPSERQAIDARRRGGPPAAIGAPATAQAASDPVSRLDGVVRRSGGRSVVWLDNVPHPVQPDGQVERAPGAQLEGDTVRMRDADGRLRTLRAGNRGADQ